MVAQTPSSTGTRTLLLLAFAISCVHGTLGCQRRIDKLEAARQRLEHSLTTSLFFAEPVVPSDFDMRNSDLTPLALPPEHQYIIETSRKALAALDCGKGAPIVVSAFVDADAHFALRLSVDWVAESDDIDTVYVCNGDGIELARGTLYKFYTKSEIEEGRGVQFGVVRLKFARANKPPATNQRAPEMDISLDALLNEPSVLVGLFDNTGKRLPPVPAYVEVEAVRGYLDEDN